MAWNGVLSTTEKKLTVLIYRGQKYLQHKEVTPKKVVELSYRRNVYTTRQAEAKKHMQSSLIYRGSSYQK